MTHPSDMSVLTIRRIIAAAVFTAYTGAGLFGHLSVGDDDVYFGTELQVTEKKAASVSFSQRPLWTKKRHYPPVPACSIADIHRFADPFAVTVRPCEFHAPADPLWSTQHDASVRIPRAPPILSL